MIPFDINKSIETVVSAIAAYEMDTKGDPSAVTLKVEEFVKSNEKAIPATKQEEIKKLLGRLTDLTTKTSTCNQLTTLINAIAKTQTDAGLKTGVTEKDNKHLVEAEEFTSEENKRFAAAKLIAQSEDRDELAQLAAEIQRYQLSEPHRIEIAEILAEKSSSFPEHMQRFAISNEATRFRIAKRIAQKKPLEISRLIGKFELKNEKYRIAIANMAAARCLDTFHLLKNYQLSDPAHILFTALRACPLDIISVNISVYQTAYKTPKDYPQVFGELQKAVDASQDERTQLWFKAFRIVIHALNEKDHVECASLAASIMNLENQEIRYRLTDALYVHGMPETAPSDEPHMKLFNILLSPLINTTPIQENDIKALWEMLGSQEYRESPQKQEKVIKGLYSLLDCKDLTSKEKGEILRHIINNKQIPLYNSLQMLEIIITTENETLLKASPEPASKEAGIKSTESSNIRGSLKQPIDLSSILTQISTPFNIKDENTARAIASNFDFFVIGDESTRFNIAKSIAEQYPRIIFENIDKFQLSEENRLTLAKSLAVRKNAVIYTSLCENIHRFHLKNGLADIFCLLAADLLCNDFLYKYIKKFGLTELERFEAAKTLASSLIKSDDPFPFSDIIANIHQFDLSYEHRLFIARQIPNYSGKCIKSFQLNEQHRLEIAQLFFLGNPQSISHYILSFDLKDEGQRLAFAKIAAAEDSLQTVEKLTAYNLTNPANILFFAMKFCLPENAPNLIKKYEDSYGPLPSKYPPAFDQLEKSIKDSQNESAKVWFSTFGAVIQQLNSESWTECASLADLIVDLSPETRYLLTAVINQYGIPSTEKRGYAKLINLLLAPLIKDSQLTESDIQAIFTILGNQKYGESLSKKENILKGLYSLLECNDLTAKEKGELLKHIIANDKTNPVHVSLQMLDAIITTKNTSMLRTAQAQIKEADQKDAKDPGHRAPLKHPIDIVSCLRKIFKISIGMSEESLKDFGQKFETTMTGARNPMALLIIYAANLGTLPQNEREATLKSLKVFTESVLNGTYKTSRYQTLRNRHLATVFAKQPQLQKEWQVGSSMSIADILKKCGKEIDTKEKAGMVNVVEYLQQRVCTDRHLDPDKFKFLAESLKDPQNSRKHLQECQKRLGEVLTKSGMKMKDIKDKPIDEKTLPVFLLHLEANLISFVVAPEIKKIKNLLPDVKKLREIGQFAQDLEDLKQRMDQQELEKEHSSAPNAPKTKSKYDNFIVADTDDWIDMELCGTEVTGSCQRIGGQVQFNKCLLAYMLDGKNRAIVIKEPTTGRIVARRIMRLLWDSTNERPVLFKERLYDNNVSQQAKQALDLMIEMRAKQLNLPLVQSASTETPAQPYANDLQSLSSPAPYEYVDAGGVGIANGGVFTISSDQTAIVNT